jgi:hypothetical protein
MQQQLFCRASDIMGQRLQIQRVRCGHSASSNSVRAITEDAEETERIIAVPNHNARII